MEEKPLNFSEPSQPQPQEGAEKKELPLQQFEGKDNKNWMKIFSLSLSALLILAAGIFTGNWLAGQRTGQLPGEKPKVVKTEKVVGSTDTKTFRDSAEGVLEEGGIDGEGTHHLVREEGRPDQNAYLTSSVVDLSEYVGKKIKVWGETFSAQKAGWLMDVGKVELLE